MNTSTARAAATVAAAVALCASATVLVAAPAHAQYSEPAATVTTRVTDPGDAVAHRKAQMSHDYVTHAAKRAREAGVAHRA